MAKPYATEMAKLADTFAWAETTDVERLRVAVKTAGLSGLRAIGSGGSLTSAHVLAGLHQRWTGRLAAVATPLEAVSEPLDPGIATWLLSAGGGNVDILRAFNVLASREPRQLGVLCGKSQSALADAAREHSFADLLLYEPPAGKDGFLATNSLLAFAAVLTRAYVSEFSGTDRWTEGAAAVDRLLKDNTIWTDWELQCSSLWGRNTTLVLHGTSTRIGAVDLESKFTEAALGNLQVADFRNFAHGRHHWLAKRADVTGMLVFVGPEDADLAKRTLAQIPPEIPRAVLTFDLPEATLPIISLICALRITGWAGQARNIDPGRPGVPEFGRKLYNLPLPKIVGSKTAHASTEQAAAIARKSGISPERLFAQGELDRWEKALAAFKGRLAEASFQGVILDYDGTVVDTRHRFEPPHHNIVAELIRLAESGARLAIATGRGASVRRDLQKCLPQSLWSRILIGYYNGAEIAGLDDNHTPDGTEGTCDALAQLANALRAQPELNEAATQTDRHFQITLEAKRALPENRLWDLAHEVLLMTAVDHVKITRSSHSIDIVSEGVSKRNVIERMRTEGSGWLLTIGDRGRWPGNDYELLREPYALSVDEVSVDPQTCWNLAPVGQRGVAATVAYLKCLRPVGEHLRFDVSGLS